MVKSPRGLGAARLLLRSAAARVRVAAGSELVLRPSPPPTCSGRLVSKGAGVATSREFCRLGSSSSLPRRPPRKMSPPSEEQVGIREFVNSSTIPFSGILKQRFSDFQVNEVDRAGNVARLASLKFPVQRQEIDVEKEPAQAAREDSVSARAAVLEAFASLAGDENAARLRGYLEKVDALVEAEANNSISPELQKEVVDGVVLEPEEDKAKRKEIHSFFKTEPRLPQMATSTGGGKDTDQPPYVQVVLQSSIKGRQHRQDGGRKRPRDSGGSGSDAWDDRNAAKPIWPGKEQFTLFHLYKENMDTQGAISALARMLRCKPAVFAFAGTKDKRAVTVQCVTAHRVRPERMAQLNRGLPGRLRVGDFRPAQRGLRIGELGGNRFGIVLRNVIGGSWSEVAAALGSVRSSGFINYFGLQRFGQGGVATHTVGALLLRGCWLDAIKAIMAVSSHDREDLSKAKKRFLDHGDAKGARKGLMGHMVAECSLMEALQREPKNFVNALESIPRNLRTMYLHAYQSYLWNSAASERIKLYGAAQAVEGDLVAIDLPSSNCSSDGGWDDSAPREPDTWQGRKVHVVTAEEAAELKFSVTQVVLPLPGNAVMYPTNDIGKVWSSLAEKDGISLTEGSHGVKEFSMIHLTGDYRYLLQKASGMTWHFTRYNDPLADLARTGLEEIEAKQDDGACGPPAPEESSYPEPDCSAPSGEGQYLAVHLKFTLPPSAYATMLIRELTKESSSTAHHKALNIALE